QAYKLRENAILDAATSVLGSKGYDLMTMDDVAGAVGISKPSLYKHFKSKEEILDAVIDRITGTLMREAEAIAANQQIPLLDRLTGSIMALNVDSRIGE
ncbi:TetR/AcrR family transcriptional regulator, partial [Salmonella enterica]|uniref:TetR/AcrR family transcriptional regulator n=1 Tax=Salmonella enterica TaxID=28901 RepID=UPI003CF314F7